MRVSDLCVYGSLLAGEDFVWMTLAFDEKLVVAQIQVFLAHPPLQP